MAEPDPLCEIRFSLKMPATTILIFPLDIDEADSFIRASRALGHRLVGASSAMPDAGDRDVDHFAHLPFITDPTFDTAFARLVADWGITQVYAPHQGVWRRLDALRDDAPETRRFALCGPDPLLAIQQRFARHELWAAARAAAAGAPEEDATSALRPVLSKARHAALHRAFLNTPGDSDAAKLAALCDIARRLPAGDLVEVGCLYGRSACALGLLARFHGIGNLVCVDPWNTAELTDQGAAAALIDIELDNTRIDSETIFRIFLGTIAALDNVGYIRKTSLAALDDYLEARRDGSLDSPELGRIALTGTLSLLHIDANHRYDHVRQDVMTWAPLLGPGGWLLLDDYVWAFGDGPCRVGDELLASPLYDSAFVSGDTLFLRRVAAGGGSGLA